MPDTVFMRAQGEATKFSRFDAIKVYDLAIAVWDCYREINKLDEPSHTRDDLSTALIAAINVYNACVPSNFPVESITISSIPAHLLKSVISHLNEGINSATETEKFFKVGDSAELMRGCEKCIDDGYEIKSISSIIKKMLLLIVHNCFECLIGDDIFTLINKCIVLDHLGCRVQGESNFLMLLEKLNKKIKDSVLDSIQEADVQKIVGNINYRLNKYKEAVSSLCKYLDCFISSHPDTIGQKENMECVLKALISIAYCHEKMNTSGSLTKAICLLENVRASRVIELRTIDILENRVLESKIVINFSLCSEAIQTEVYHALSHFYNERAVFHKSPQKEEDILIARKYISIAKSRDKENAFHACHGLICHEDTNYWFAITLYREALKISAIASDYYLKNELLFYLAQSEYAIGCQDQANKHLAEFTDFCKLINNEDALAHARIMQVKSELSSLNIFGDIKPSFFQEKLNLISEMKPSLYVPVSVQYEWKKIIYAINVFNYTYRIFKKEIELPVGIEEIVYNLQKYSDKSNGVIPHHLEIPKDKINDNLRKNDQDRLDGFYFLEYKGVHLLCFGDYFALPRGSEKNGNPLGQIVRDYENSIISQLSNNARPDVLIFTPSADFLSQDGRTELLKQLLKTKVCVVTSSQEALSIISRYNDEQISSVHLANSTDMLLQLGFSFFVYERLRYDLATPTPLLGLAPLGESKSYSYQAGEKTDLLLVPNLRNANTSRETNPMKRTLLALDKTRIEMQKDASAIIDYRCVIKNNTSSVENLEGVSLIAFFPNPLDRENENGNFTVPYIIKESNILGIIKYIPPFRINTIYSYPPENFITYKASFLQLSVYLNAPQFCMAWCADQDDNTCDNDSLANVTCLKRDCEETNAVFKLLRHILPIYELDGSFCCLWRRVNTGNGSYGMLLVIVKVSDDEKDVILHNICKSIKTDPIGTPITISYDAYIEENTKNEEDTSRESEKHPSSEGSSTLSKNLFNVVDVTFRELEEERERLYKYWQEQDTIFGKENLKKYAREKKSRLLSIAPMIETLKYQWQEKPPHMINTEDELMMYLNQEENYKEILSCLSECKQST